jgi:AGCS family alanine or glycine:cation symporter
MEVIDGWLSAINGYLWGPPMLVLLFGTHLFFTVRLLFVQRYTGLGIKLSLTPDAPGKGDISQFGALATALAATVGTGNIVGVATAVALGGPGAVLWCWLTGVFGMATKYAEALLAVKYRVQTADGTFLGGPMYALERGLKLKWLAVLFALFTVLASFGIGNMVQANAIASMASETFGVAPWMTGVVLMALVGAVILGGIRSIARMCIALVPVMVIFYVAGCLTILVLEWSTLPATLQLIVQSAFTGPAAAGGAVGSGIMLAARYGIARGVFSNESGLGSAPIVAAAAQTRNPVRQALVSATGTFWDTVVICAITGITIVNSGLWQDGLDGSALTKSAFDLIPTIGPIVLTVGLFTFVFSTILGWSYYGERALEYLFGKRAIFPYRLAWVGAVLLGSLVTLQMVWNFADMANALMAIPNLVALLLLNGIIVAETRKYLWSGRIDETADEVEIPAMAEVPETE